MDGPHVRALSPEKAVAFLARDPVGNVELLGAIRYDADVHCFGVEREGALAGLLVVGREVGDDALTMRIEAAEMEAVTALLAVRLPDVRRIAVHRPWMLPALAAAFPLIPEQERDRVFSATAVALPPSPRVRPLTMADAPMVAASATLWGRTGLRDALAEGFRPFGIVEDRRLIAGAMAANATGWTEEVMAVWTTPRRRGQGLASLVVTATTADILTRYPTAIYVAGSANLASQRVAMKVGFRRSHEVEAYRIARRKREQRKAPFG